MSLPSSQIIQQPLPDWFSTFRLFINQSQVFCAHRQWMLEMPFFCCLFSCPILSIHIYSWRPMMVSTHLWPRSQLFSLSTVSEIISCLSPGLESNKEVVFSPWFFSTSALTLFNEEWSWFLLQILLLCLHFQSFIVACESQHHPEKVPLCLI